jgi:hypothetical protein
MMIGEVEANDILGKLFSKIIGLCKKWSELIDGKFVADKFLAKYINFSI